MELQTVEKITQEVDPNMNAANNLRAQVTRAIANSSDTMARCGDLMKVINGNIKRTEDARKALVSPINKHVKWINAQFKPITESLDESKNILRGKMDAYAKEELEQARKEAEAQKEKIEGAIMDLAEIEQQNGNVEKVDILLNAANDIPGNARPEIKRGEYGSTTFTKEVWKFEVEDIKALCLAVANGEIPIEAVMPNNTFIRKHMNDHKDNACMAGVRFYKDVQAGVR